MRNEAQKQFVAALNFLLRREGRGSQAKLARALKIDSGYLNNIVKGRSPGSQEKKEKIAAYFDLHYESMLSLGRWLLSGNQPAEEWKPTQWEEWRNIVNSGKSLKHTRQDHESPSIYEFSPRDKKDKNMRLIAEWINQQEDPGEYWTLLKMFLRREEPDFKEWLKKRASTDNKGGFPENKSAVGE